LFTKRKIKYKLKTILLWEWYQNLKILLQKEMQWI
jgi:hypothetical protein